MSRRYEWEREVAIEAVREAARLCRAVAAEISPEVLAKKDKSPVTVADFGSQALICRALAEAFPDDPSHRRGRRGRAATARRTRPILDQVLRHVRAVRERRPGERTRLTRRRSAAGSTAAARSQYRDRFWTLDPIDGTKGFLRGEQYAVALALIVEGQVVVAALACPNLSCSRDRRTAPRAPGCDLLRRERAGGVCRAWRSPGGSSRAGAAPRQSTATIRRPCGSASRSSPGIAPRATRRPSPLGWGSRPPPLRMDSQAKYAVVARGEADIYLRLPTRADYREKIWDHAAGALIVAEAGGVVTDIHGRPLEFHHGRELTANRGVIVTNGRLHDRVLEAIRGAGDRRRSSTGVGDAGRRARSGWQRDNRCESGTGECWSTNPASRYRLHPVDLAARAGRGLPVGVRLAGRAARRADRVAGHPAGGGVPRPRPAAPRHGAGRPTGGCRPCSGSMRRTRRLHGALLGRRGARASS